MLSTSYIPKEIIVGFNRCSADGTWRYGKDQSGLLGYATYKDEKGVLRKETSFNNWKNEDIPVRTIENSPIDGFSIVEGVLGDKYSWFPRNPYIVISDPRGFFIQIPLDNVITIIKEGEILNGKIKNRLIYSWNGIQLTLMIYGGNDYKEATSFTSIINEKPNFTVSDMMKGDKFRTKSGDIVYYYGKYDRFREDGTNEGKFYWFIPSTEEYGKNIPITYRKVPKTIIKREILKFEDLDIFNKYEEIVEGNPEFSPVDWERKPTFEPARDIDRIECYGFLSNIDGAYKKYSCYGSKGSYEVRPYTGSYSLGSVDYINTLENLNSKYNPKVVRWYLKNGNKISGYLYYGNYNLILGKDEL